MSELFGCYELDEIIAPFTVLLDNKCLFFNPSDCPPRYRASKIRREKKAASPAEYVCEKYFLYDMYINYRPPGPWAVVINPTFLYIDYKSPDECPPNNMQALLHTPCTLNCNCLRLSDSCPVNLLVSVSFDFNFPPSSTLSWLVARTTLSSGGWRAASTTSTEGANLLVGRIVLSSSTIIPPAVLRRPVVSAAIARASVPADIAVPGPKTNSIELPSPATAVTGLSPRANITTNGEMISVSPMTISPTALLTGVPSMVAAGPAADILGFYARITSPEPAPTAVTGSSPEFKIVHWVGRTEVRAANRSIDDTGSQNCPIFSNCFVPILGRSITDV